MIAEEIFRATVSLIVIDKAGEERDAWRYLRNVVPGRVVADWSDEELAEKLREVRDGISRVE